MKLSSSSSSSSFSSLTISVSSSSSSSSSEEKLSSPMRWICYLRISVEVVVVVDWPGRPAILTERRGTDEALLS